MNKRALVRRPGPRLEDGLLTHLERAPVDAEKAMRQWFGYVAALQAEGWELFEVEPADDCPDAVFVEDTAVVYGDLAVVTRPGADQRKPETTGTEDALLGLGYRVSHIEPPGHPRRWRRPQARRHGLGRARRTDQPGRPQPAARPPRAAGRHRRRRPGHQGAAPEVRGHRAPRRDRDRLRPARRRPDRVPGVPLGPGGARRPRRPPRRLDGADGHVRPTHPGAVRVARAARGRGGHLRVREARGLRDLSVDPACAASQQSVVGRLGRRHRCVQPGVEERREVLAADRRRPAPRSRRPSRCRTRAARPRSAAASRTPGHRSGAGAPARAMEPRKYTAPSKRRAGPGSSMESCQKPASDAKVS